MELERVKEEAGRPEWMERIGEYGNYDGQLPESTSDIMSANRIRPIPGLLSNPEGIFGSNLDRLRSLKMRYDPDNVFDKSHSLLPAKIE